MSEGTGALPALVTLNTLVLGANDIYKDAWKIREWLREGRNVALCDPLGDMYPGNGYLDDPRILFELFDMSIDEFPITYVLAHVHHSAMGNYPAWRFCLTYWQRTRNAKRWQS